MKHISSQSRPDTQASARRLWRIGLPIAVGMGATIGLGVTDTLVAGLAGADAIAALAIGANVFIVAVMLLVGLSSVVAPRISRLAGAGRFPEVVRDCRRSAWLGFYSGLLLSLVLWLARPVIFQLGLVDAVAALAASYVSVVVFALPLLGLCSALRNVLDGLHRTATTMRVSLLVFVANALLDLLLVPGWGGLPAMGPVGCAWATVAVSGLQCVLLLRAVLADPRLTGLDLRGLCRPPRFAELGALAALGLPAAFALTLEEGFFSATVWLAAPLGTAVLAAHQLLLSLTMMFLTLPIGLGQAGAILVGEALGRDGGRATGLVVRRILRQVMLIMSVSAALAAMTGLWLLPVYNDDVAVNALVFSVLPLCAVQLLADGFQITSGIILKGYQDTLRPGLHVMVACWLVGFPLAWLLSRGTLLPAVDGLPGIWIGMFLAVSLVAALNGQRLYAFSHDPGTV
ncbi:MATE family efflux transporter [Granulosicoccaceae sp. 1_MG-2023]|nr:MATE family efflux transporter [Granulosicoccaceae sp. 1_MG-2023]